MFPMVFIFFCKAASFSAAESTNVFFSFSSSPFCFRRSPASSLAYMKSVMGLLAQGYIGSWRVTADLLLRANLLLDFVDLRVDLCSSIKG
jgi:hypothetical protein